ncbi:FAD-binding oxidoreductase [Notoacmeibacter sp. MSK16QG-6]|uniref:FAD-binding oxidoreductase n=1 Tax=Notoacmeibacter sp. MSK16QG-6 TaxID=2957982 RepID=UPI0020A089A5|nr:FAD-binding oxidoreductase [Notoacmeibacter sp. MSK16QG-6]MCP1200563.1 FAD-binding oxidoreductase [Notoacmeibacter sp. MSK16QG-6]
MKPSVAPNAVTGDLPEGFVQRLRDALPASAVIDDPDRLAALLVEERGLFESQARIAIAPSTTEELSMAVRICAEAQVPMVPQGGNTGLVGGAVASAGEAVISLRRMDKIRQVDPVNYTITVEAGAILADIQAAATRDGCLFPLSLGAEGSCTIGGNLASNAGGVGVLKYGNARELCLGLEVVLADGTIWNGMRPLYKDNSGFALKHLFIGSEGSVGFITAAVLKLFPAPADTQTAFCALPSVEAALSLLSLARRESGDQVTAFELMSGFACGIVCDHAGGAFPLEARAPWYALIELSTSREASDLRPVFEGILEKAFEDGLVTDAVIAESLDQSEKLWALRERTPEAQKKAGGSIKHDISVPVSRIPEFIGEAGAAVEEYMPGIHLCAFGHVGDGNVHFNFTQPDHMAKDEFLGHWEAVNDIVHPIAMKMNGSISAEHGLGLLKAAEIRSYRSKAEHDINVTLKQALDPHGLMNPGKFIVL